MKFVPYAEAADRLREASNRAEGLFDTERDFAMPWCKLCRRCAVTEKDPICDRCVRLSAIGVLVVMAVGRRVVDRDVDDSDVGEALSMVMFCATLDAIAFLMEDRRKLFREMNRALRDESREAQRDARDAYQEGRRDGIRGDDF